MSKLVVSIAALALFTTSAMAMPPQNAQAPASIQGKIAETMNSGGYTYLKLTTDKGEVWAAIPETTVKVGSSAVIATPMLMTGFESKTLKRKFDQIYFGSLGGAPAEAGNTSALPQGPKVPSMGMGMGKGMAGQPHGTPAPAIQLSEIKVAKAAGGKTVAEIYGEKAALKGKPIAVRGKVTKASMGIMGKNWLHISDGSGKTEDKNFDLTVSTTGIAKVGDVVLVKGTLGADRDIGAGYFYPVIIEDAKLEK